MKKNGKEKKCNFYVKIGKLKIELTIYKDIVS